MTEQEQRIAIAQAQVCPVCAGKGIVPDGFYNFPGMITTSTNTTEPSRTCNGTGIVWPPKEK